MQRCASPAAWTGARWHASTCSTTGSTAHPRPARDPASGGSNTVALKDCPALRDPQRSLLGLDQERWLAAGWDHERSWNLVGAADPDGTPQLERSSQRRNLLD
ncbi:MAG: hypothetical protein V9G29_03690 [Burkholderiaceae bacterium]